jgi:hypothetical protein
MEVGRRHQTFLKPCNVNKYYETLETSSARTAVTDSFKRGHLNSWLGNGRDINETHSENMEMLSAPTRKTARKR